MHSEVTSVYVPVQTRDYKLWAIVLSILVHGLLLAALVFFYHRPNPPPMETSLVTPEQLAEIEDQIRANQQNNAGQAGADASAYSKIAGLADDLTTPNSPPTVTHNPQHDYSAAVRQARRDLLARESTWEREQKQLAEQIERESQQLIEQVNEHQLAEQQALEQNRRAESDIEQTQRELRDVQASYNKSAFPTRDANTPPSQGRSLNLATDGRALGTGQSSGGNGPSHQGAATGGNSAGYLSQISSIIKNNWDPPTNTAGQRLKASFTISANGTISNISVSGSADEVFKASLIKAIQAASPLPPPPNDDVKRITSNFIAN